MDYQAIINTIKSIALYPKKFWAGTTVGSKPPLEILKSFLGPLVIVGSIADFIKQSIIGTSFPVIGTIRIGIFDGIYNLIVYSVLAVVGLFIGSIVVEKVSQKFGGNITRNGAFEFLALSSAVGLAAKVLVILPSLGWLLAALAGAYSLYIFWTGVPSQTGVIEKDRPKFVAITLVIMLVINLIISLFLTKPSPTSISLSTPYGEFNTDQMEDAAKKFGAEADKLQKMFNGATNSK